MKNSLFLKALVVGALAAALLVPVSMIRELVGERQQRAAEAVAGIAEGWGHRQVVEGPYVAIPYERHWTEVKRETVDGRPRETRIERKESQVLRAPAASVDWIAGAEISEKQRSLYKARLYSARLQAKGRLVVPATAPHEDGTSRYRWGVPRLVLGISDPHGIRAATVSVDGRDLAFSAGPGDRPVAAGLHALLPGARAATLDFALALDLGGSESLAIAPRGADTTVAMRADWPHPSFLGRFLPERHEIGAGGFSASWRVSRLAAQGTEPLIVSFVEPAGLYQQLERAGKYGFLFIGLTFAAFFLFEVLRRLPIHPVQYALVGLALAMFFLLLTALSEHIAFAYAYAAAALACVVLLTGYLFFVLRGPIAFAFGAALAGVYAILYLLLKAEDYSLLGGSVFLFVALASVMLATRRVDWYALRAARAQA
ncbi:MAG TPA: cell envelope integrity protein CreD [Burkholderiales bacterium]|nr:cell envelope integrity protein CreD [Burkholderiales bacterium]